MTDGLTRREALALLVGGPVAAVGVVRSGLSGRTEQLGGPVSAQPSAGPQHRVFMLSLIREDGTEVKAPSYARRPVTFEFAPDDDVGVVNREDVVWPEAEEVWGKIVEAGIWTTDDMDLGYLEGAFDGPVELYRAQIVPPVTVDFGVTFMFARGDLTVDEEGPS